jgi:hypothetical protein
MNLQVLRKNDLDGGYTIFFSGQVSSREIEELDLRAQDKRRVDGLTQHSDNLIGYSKRLATLSMLFMRCHENAMDADEAMLRAVELIERVRHDGVR